MKKINDKTMHNTSVTDEPVTINKDTNDPLNMWTFTQGLCRFIEQADTPITIALQGEWGCGKTSMMRSVESCLASGDQRKFNGIWINTWQHSVVNEDLLSVVSILHDIVAQISKAPNAVSKFDKTLQKARKIGEVAGLALASIAVNLAGIRRLGVGGVGNNVVQEVHSFSNVLFDTPPIVKLKTEIANLVKGERKFLFFIDDLDRINPEVAVRVLEVLKNIFDIPNCIFVLALDYEVVVKGLKPKFGERSEENEHEFRSFFDKIIQLPFQMPVRAYQIDKFLMQNLISVGFVPEQKKNDADFEQALNMFVVNSIGTNPRSIKRLVNYLSLIRLLVETTTSTTDDRLIGHYPEIVVALVCLQIQYPDVYRTVERYPNFSAWDEAVAKSLALEDLSAEEKEAFSKTQEFDDEWEQVLYRICKKYKSLKPFSYSLSQFLNMLSTRIKSCINSNQFGNHSEGDLISRLIKISSITSIKSGHEEMIDGREVNAVNAIVRMRDTILDLQPDRGRYIRRSKRDKDFVLVTQICSTSDALLLGVFARGRGICSMAEFPIRFQAGSGSCVKGGFYVEGSLSSFDWGCPQKRPEFDFKSPRAQEILLQICSRLGDWFVGPNREQWVTFVKHDADAGNIAFRLDFPFNGDKVNEFRAALRNALWELAKAIRPLEQFIVKK